MFPNLPDAGGLAKAELEQLTRWLMEMGVDTFCGDAPRDRFADSAAALASGRQQAEQQPAQQPTASPQPAAAQPRQPPRPPLQAPAPIARPAAAPAAMVAQDAAAQSAREIAAAARTLDDLRAALEAFDGCGLKRTASRLVFADGNPAADVMFVGEAPGADEDRSGKPFVGRAGQLLNKMMAAIGLDRESAYIANVTPWRPPGNRPPTPQETAVCLPFIRRQIALANPKIVVCLGAPSMQSLLGVREGILRARGNWYDLTIETDEGPRLIKALATLHPAYLLRTPTAKRLAWRDLRELKKALAASG